MIPSFSGKLPSPLPQHAPQGRADLRPVGDAHVRGWVDDAARREKLPTELPAAILQNENGPRSTFTGPDYQVGDRGLTMAATVADHLLGGIVPDKASAGSTGIGNMTRPTLKGAKSYVDGILGRPLAPDEVARRDFGVRPPAIAALERVARPRVLPPPPWLSAGGVEPVGARLAAGQPVALHPPAPGYGPLPRPMTPSSCAASWRSEFIGAGSGR